MKNKGIITTYVLVFGAIFLLLISGLFGFILMQLKQASQKIAWNESMQISEAGINYYRWCLNNDEQDNCLTEKEYTDPAGTPIGTFSLNVDSKLSCGETIEKTITSTGWTNRFPQVKRQIRVLYARTSVGQYAYLLNDNVWAGSDREIRGLYHSNNGIRMDGENQSLVTSAAEDWICTDSFGCSSCPTSDGCRIESSNCVCPSVFTTTGNADETLFNFPIPPFDFDGITVDLAEMKDKAQTELGGIYLPPSTDIDSSGDGYHVIFLNDGDIEVWIITGLQSTPAYSSEEGWHDDYFTINNEYLYNTYSANPSCSVIFIEDNLWVEGEVKGKITIASADLINPTNDTSIVLPGNINYTTFDGSDGLSIIGEKNVLISPDSPNQMELRGIFIAQKGHFGRNHYPGNIKEKLELYGSVVSNGRVGTKWSSGGQIVSGYLNRENYFDQNLVYSPPPFVPYVTSEFSIVEWEEVE